MRNKKTNHEEHEDHEDFLNIIFVIFVVFVVKIRVFFVVNPPVFVLLRLPGGSICGRSPSPFDQS